MKVHLQQDNLKIRALEENELKLTHKLEETLKNNKETQNELMLIRKNLQNQIEKLEQDRNYLEKQIHEYSQEIKQKDFEFKQLLDNKESEDVVESSKITYLESKTINLEVHISKLENINADLENRLVKLQSSRGIDLNNPSSPSPSPFGARILPQKSNYSGYSSEDIPQVTSGGWSGQDEEGDINQRTINSSPDLGIESDQGRFSSLETNVVNEMRPFLPPLQLTHSMNSMLANVTQNDNGKFYFSNRWNPFTLKILVWAIFLGPMF